MATLVLVVICIVLFGLAWHDMPTKPARSLSVNEKPNPRQRKDLHEPKH